MRSMVEMSARSGGTLMRASRHNSLSSFVEKFPVNLCESIAARSTEAEELKVAFLDNCFAEGVGKAYL